MRAQGWLAILASSACLMAKGQADSNVCSTQDRTYSTETMPAGTYQPSSELNPVVGALSTQFYVTVVNLTPYRFVLSSTHSYQMDTFDFGDVPQGHARQNSVKYKSTLFAKDDAGEAYYQITGTSQTFALRVKSYFPDTNSYRVVLDLSGMSLGQREYVFPGAQSSVSLVITGGSTYGFQASLTYGPGNWMHSLYGVIGDRAVRHLILPGSHDAGMSQISNAIDSIGSESNTQTQGISVYNQLRAGSRWFDLRIASVHANGNANQIQGFWAMHVNDETASISIGNTGESLDTIISEINQFTSENPGELVFLAMRYLVGRYELPDNGPIYWNQSTVDTFFAKLRGINNRCGNLDTSTGFQNQNASYFLDQNSGAGCVIPLLNGDLNTTVSQESIPDGIYAFNRISVQDHWSNMEDASSMGPDQITNWRAVTRGSGASDYGSLLIAQWLVTPSALDSTAYSLQSYALQPTNPSLYWAGVNGMDPEHWPNVLLTDYIGVQLQDQWGWDQLSAELYTLAVGLNLYMASENCGVNPLRSPLLGKRGEGGGGGGAERGRWNGIIFANGTRIDHPPPELHPGHAEVLRKGTRLGNGTVLARDVPNPWV